MKRNLLKAFFLILVITTASCASPKHTMRVQHKAKSKMAYSKLGKKTPTWLRLYWSVVKASIVTSAIKP